jgi:hypothetical protein
MRIYFGSLLDVSRSAHTEGLSELGGILKDKGSKMQMTRILGA